MNNAMGLCIFTMYHVTKIAGKVCTYITFTAAHTTGICKKENVFRISISYIKIEKTKISIIYVCSHFIEDKKQVDILQIQDSP